MKRLPLFPEKDRSRKRGCIYERKSVLTEKGKKLTSADDNVLTSAEKLVREEFAYTLGITEDEVGEYIREKIEG